MAGILGSFKGKSTINLSGKRFAIIVAEWNEEITEALFEGAQQALIQAGANPNNIFRKSVPGSFELPLAAKWSADQKDIDAVICIGCVIQGDTPHFDYICQAVAQGIMQVNLESGKPVAFGVLTTLNRKQALERAGGSLGNKGEEAAMTVVRMLEVKAK
ncbi:MAG TPA: 6,7-dimethyl-8-ribityllumazine synthase [Cyclobacteriaceae bacterium]|nr:6,7-dimethyl-8-ribityllumazine synthase [Cyclobacteriaceae bacterium]